MYLKNVRLRNIFLAILAGLVFLTLGACTPESGLNLEGDTEQLLKLIGEAKSLLGTAVVSDKADTVDKGTKWVTQAGHDAFQMAIDAAQKVADDKDAKWVKITAAIAALNQAIEHFEKALQDGIRDPVVNLAALQKEIADANAAKLGVLVASDPNNVAQGQPFVSQTVMDTFEQAIADAEAVRDDTSITQQDADDAVSALHSAAVTFEAAKQLGTNAGLQPVDRSALSTAITNADAAKLSAVVETDAQNVDVGTDFVDAQVMAALEQAIVDAETISQNAAATQQEIDDAAADLNKAVGVFNAAKQPGTRLVAAFDSLVSDGSSQQSSTKLIFTFDQDVPLFNLADIDLGSTAVQKDQLTKTQSTGVYELTLTAITQTDVLTVTLAKQGVRFVPSSRTVTVYHILFVERQGNGTLVSQGKSAAADTYYIDAVSGDDANNGTSPITPWKSFRNANSKTFNPGDHILLEADSIWNGETVTPANNPTLLSSDTVGMLWPKGSGSAGNPIIIDLYDIDNMQAATPVVSYSANKRPVINGNGTPSPNPSKPYETSGAVNLKNQDHWEIYNIECTNSFANISQDTDHWTKIKVNKMLAGIFVNEDDSAGAAKYRHIVIKNCYVHDVQSESTNNKQSYWTSTYFGSGAHTSSKVVGGIIVNGAFSDLVLEGNIVKKAGLEGLRTGGGAKTNVAIRGNYVEAVMGDGIVISGVNFSLPSSVSPQQNLVEHNIVKDAAASPLNDESLQDTANYAACWVYQGKQVRFSRNEAYGTLYGYLDGEAWDIDNDSSEVIYQYNYSHHNAGGACLFMSSATNSIFRYNISANDGGGARYMETIDDNGIQVDTSAASYTDWTDGQSIFHYTVSASTAGPTVPLVYNNTIYIGDGISTALYGNTSLGNANKYVRFYNNILLKAGAGTVPLCNTHNPPKSSEGYLTSPAAFKNNLLYAYDINSGAEDKSKFTMGAGGVTVADLLSTYNNHWADPNLLIQSDPSNAAALRAQRDDAFTAYNDPAALAVFTDTTRLRDRARMFSLTDDQSPAFEAGMAIPAAKDPAIDNAWNDGGVTEDFFGAAIDASKPPIGAAVTRY
ncbi:MAG: right-handed parallel beta-helix repeat-containing protein [Treponema sp.]|nr:right-handed parallel beta-helix repeat-containing protein [Treponema sp.]